MKFFTFFSISLLATVGAALPNAAALNPRADTIACSSGGTCVAYNQCQAVIDGKSQTFTDLSCRNFGKKTNSSSDPDGSAVVGHS